MMERNETSAADTFSPPRSQGVSNLTEMMILHLNDPGTTQPEPPKAPQRSK